MQEGSRWIVAILAVAAILALLLFARGVKEHGSPQAPPAAVTVELGPGQAPATPPGWLPG